MTKNEWIESEVAKYKATFPTDKIPMKFIRSVMARAKKEFEYWEKEAVREDNHNTQY